jgi:hypothetical protein
MVAAGWGGRNGRALGYEAARVCVAGEGWIHLLRRPRVDGHVPFQCTKLTFKSSIKDYFPGRVPSQIPASQIREPCRLGESSLLRHSGFETHGLKERFLSRPPYHLRRATDFEPHP